LSNLPLTLVRPHSSQMLQFLCSIAKPALEIAADKLSDH